MAEVQQRSSGSRGRGSARGGRGGYVSRGGRPKAPSTGKENTHPTGSYEDQGEIGQLKKQYASQLETIKEMFPDWTSEDLVFALQETGGNLESTINRISEGNVAQWGEVKKKTKDRARSKVKEGSADAADGSTRSSRGRGDGARSGRNRGSERGRGAGRGRGANTNGARKPPVSEAPAAAAAPAETEPSWDDAAAPQQTADGWDQPAETGTTSPDASWEIVTPSEAPSAPAPAPAAEQPKPSARPDGTRSWASMLRPAPKPQVAPAKPKPTAPVEEAHPAVETPANNLSSDSVSHEVHEMEQPSSNTVEEPAGMTPDINLTPTKDPLTERNLEQVEDASKPVETATAASTAGTNDPRSAAASVTSLHPSQPTATAVRPGLGGYATTAMKATSNATAIRTPSFQRRMKEQQEAVVMPGNHAVDRATVQFGSMGLNGDLDVDEDREEAETRTQPPQHSPLAPRASLPPMPQAAMESLSAPRPAPGLSHPSPSNQPSQMEHGTTQQPTPGNYPSYNQFGNPYGASTAQGETSAQPSKGYEPFGQQAQQQSSQPSYEAYSSNAQAPGQQAQSTQPSLGGYSSAAGDYSSYYTSDGQRTAYQHLYGNFSQPGQNGPGSTTPQTRVASTFGSSAGENPSASATSQPSQGQQQQPGRFPATSEAQTSGHSTPNLVPGHQAGQHHSQAQAHQAHHQTAAAHHGGYPGYGASAAYAYGPYGYGYGMGQYGAATAAASHHHHQQQQSQQQQQQQQQQQHSHQYGRERPLFDDVRRYDESYMGQQQGQQGQQPGQHHPYSYGGGVAAAGYGGGPYGSKGYGQPHQGYGISPGAYGEHSASPANVGGYGQQPHGMPGGGRGESASGHAGYGGRAGSTQPSENQQQQQGSSNTTFSSMPDVFGRSQSGLGQQQQQGANQPSGQQGSGSDDAGRGFPDPASKAPGGPSPAPGQSARPASAVNNGGGAQTSQAPSQQGYSGYPGHYLGGLGQQGGAGGQHQGGAGGAQQSHQGSGYGTYAGSFGGYYGGNSRGWGNYGH